LGVWGAPPPQTADPYSPVHGRDPEEVLAELAPREGPERILDLQLRCGPYRLTLAELEAAPHGIDLGPLEPRIPEVLRTRSGKIELVPEALVADVARLHEALAEPVNGAMVLVGRRDVRSNNSWMHNLPMLMKGKPRCTALVHSVDAERLGLTDGEPATVRSRTGEVVVPVEVTDDVMPGVVSIPHGWGHDLPGMALGVAADRAGTNTNVLADELLLEPLSGTAVLNGIPVELVPARPRVC
jgi:anaerobic selenocysteine-containing dehydrogenase